MKVHVFVLVLLPVIQYSVARSVVKYRSQQRHQWTAEKGVKSTRIFEGDILLDQTTQDLLRNLRRRQVRSAISAPNRKWSSNKIPYNFGAVSWSVKEAVKKAILELEKHTCIRFVPRKKEKDYIHIVSHGENCWSSIGRSGGKQRLSLGKGCERKGVALHELMHVLGFFHEQSRLDREKYVTVYLSNVDKDQHYNFQTYSHGEADPLDLPYDYGSIMHYPKDAFSSNGYPTIVPKDRNAAIGQRVALSKIDIKKINKFYKCSSFTTASTTTEATTTVTSPHPPVISYCRNRGSYCYVWAYVGYCRHRNEGYTKYMKINCRKSCNFC